MMSALLQPRRANSRRKIPEANWIFDRQHPLAAKCICAMGPHRGNVAAAPTATTKLWDAGPYGLHGILNLGTFQNGPHGREIDFDGTGDYVAMTDHAVWDFNSADAWSHFFFFRPDVLIAEFSPIWSQQEDVDYLVIYTHTRVLSDTIWGVTAGVAFGIVTGGEANYVVRRSTENVFVAGNYYALVVTYDPSLAQASRMSIYVNGVDVTGSSTSVGTLGNLSVSTIRIAATTNAGEDLDGAFVTGYIWKGRVLTSGEAHALYQNPFLLWKPPRRTTFGITAAPAIADLLYRDPIDRFLQREEVEAVPY